MRLSLVVLDVGKPTDQAFLYLATAHDHLSTRGEKRPGVFGLFDMRDHYFRIKPGPSGQPELSA